MGKYYLIGYLYNNQTKKKENITYYKEYNNLIELDKYTSIHSKYELLEEISKKNPHNKLNSIEIIYYPKKEEELEYSMPAVIDNIEFYKTAHNVVVSKKKDNRYYIQYLDPNVYEERYKFEGLLINNKKKLIDIIYPDNDYDSYFKNMINDYFKYPTDDKLDKISDEFSRYKNYRRWITCQSLLKNNSEYIKNVLEITDEMYKEFTREDLENMFDIYKEFKSNKRKH